MADIATGAIEIDETGLEGAVSSIVVSFSDEQPTMSSAASASFAYQVIRGIPKDYSTDYMKKVRDVGPKEMKQALIDWVVPVFDPAKSDLVVACSAIMEEKMRTDFVADGFGVEVQPLAYFQDYYGFGGSDEISDEDVDEDGEEEWEEDTSDDSGRER